MNAHCKALIWKIVDCGLTYCPLSSHVCNPLYLSQGCKSIDDFHIPEPWNGDIENAPILFVSLNPGFTPGELYPRLGYSGWTKPALSGVVFDNGKVEDFFENRFDPAAGYVTHANGSKFAIKMENGNIEPLKGRSYWGYVKSIADKILGRKSNIGKDFAITELVHCKSKSIKIIPKACHDDCMQKHLDDVLAVANNMQYLVVVGAETRKRVAKHFGMQQPIAKYKWYQLPINHHMVNVVFVDHNAGGGSAQKVPVPVSK